MTVLDNHEIKIGIEEEFFITNQDGFLVPQAEQIANSILNIIRKDRERLSRVKMLLKGIQWEANPTQLEYVTRPLPLTELINAIREARNLVGEAAENLNLNILPSSVHPIQSTPNPINGTHINVSVLTGKRPIKREAIFHVFRHLRNYMPELIAISANSMILGARFSPYKSSRLAYSNVLSVASTGKLKRVNYYIRPRRYRDITRYGIMFEGYKKKEKKIIIDPYGNRLLDITVRGPYTNILADTNKKISETRIEIRAIDNQLNEQYLYDISKIIAALTLEGLESYYRGEKIKERDHYEINRKKAIESGLEATFLLENGEKSARACFLEMIEKLEPYFDMLGVKLETSIKNGVSELERFGNIEIIDQNPKLSELEFKGRIFVTVRVKGKVKGYTITGKEKILDDGTKLLGMIVPHYQLSVERDGGIIKRVKKIKVNHWIITNYLYIPYSENLVIRNARGPIKQHYHQIKKIVNFIKQE